MSPTAQVLSASDYIMLRITDKKRINFFIAICCLVYFTSYLTRKNYDAALVEIYSTMGISKTLASLASTGAVVTYGAGQLLSGVLGDRLKPRNIILTGLLVTSACNVLLPLSGNVYLMIAVWCVNGLAQAMMWPPLVRIMSEALDSDNYKRAILFVTIASSCATIFVYLLVPFCIEVTRWQTAFYISSASAAIVAVFWTAQIKRFERGGATQAVAADKGKQREKQPSSEPLKVGSKYILASGLVPIAAAIVLQGTLRDGVTTWLPTIVNEVYRLDTSVSILSTIALPLLSIFSATAAAAIQRRLRNEVSSARVFFTVSLLSALALIRMNSSGAAISVALMAIITACMHGINMMLVCEVPNYFAKYNKVSTISGVLNSFTYLGSAVSIYGIAVISDKFNDWNLNFEIWAIISAVGLICCTLALKKWKKFRNI